MKIHHFIILCSFFLMAAQAPASEQLIAPHNNQEQQDDLWDELTEEEQAAINRLDEIFDQVPEEVFDAITYEDPSAFELYVQQLLSLIASVPGAIKLAAWLRTHMSDFSNMMSSQVDQETGSLHEEL